MTTVLNVSLDDLSSQFINDLKQKFSTTTIEVEIRLQDQSPADDLFSDDDFWSVIDKIDWSKKGSENKIAPAMQVLSQMPVVNICLFADKLSEKLFQLDTRAHANTYAANEPENFISADDFLYARCAVIAEGKEYYEKVLNDPAQMPEDIIFEPLLYLADDAFEAKSLFGFS
ncbi:MAG: DUF4240 domain-containing protein [Gammaproteobacteria bacterium]|nr:DUF4240 domain-containing protein [Gammaproteobacteria bacterium]